jgi:flagellar motility protein MotE (MotC chaperone)
MPPIIISLIASIAFLGGLLGGTALSVSKIKLPPPPPKKAPFVEAVPPKTFDDFSRVASELDTWRRELAEKNNKALLLDAELARREQMIGAERDALDKERARLTQVQKDMEDRLIKIKENEGPRLQQLADLYATMKPEGAVALLRALPNDQATKVLAVIPKKILAKLLDAWLANYPGDKAIIAQVTNDLVRTISDASAATNAGGAGPVTAGP